MRYSFLPGVLFVALMWYIFILAYIFEADLATLGLYPRKLSGLPGILATPLIHSDLPHLLSNSFPLLILPAIILFSYPSLALRVFVGLYFFTGFFTWFLARPAFHIGASGVVYGLASFVFFSGVFRRDRGAVALSFIIIFLYGGMIYGVFPTEERVSWESHLIGGMCGMVFAFIYRNVDRPAQEPELEELEEEETWIPYQIGAEKTDPAEEAPAEVQPVKVQKGDDWEEQPKNTPATPTAEESATIDASRIGAVKYTYIPRDNPDADAQEEKKE